MAINFPNNPTTNQVFNSNGKTWRWNGTSWSALRGPLSSPENTPVIATGSTVARSLANRFADVVNVKDFGVVGNGITDDTVKLLDAFQYCRDNNKVLQLSGQIVFNKSSVPISKIHLNEYGDYVYACSMQGDENSELLITGKIGFDFLGVNNLLLERFNVTTFGREMGENQLENTSPHLFATTSGSKQSAIYKDIKIYHTVTNLTGQYRAGYSIREYGCNSILIDNVIISNTTIGYYIEQSQNISTRNTYFYNVQTGFVFRDSYKFQVGPSHLINTAIQQNNWVAKLASPARTSAGMSHLLVEGGDNGTVIGLHTKFACEASVYIQASNISISDCYALNTGGYKLVGLAYDNQAENYFVDNVNVIIDDGYDFNLYPTRGIHLVSSYWSKNLTITNSSIINTVNGRHGIQAAIHLGYPDGATYENITINNVHATNVERLHWTLLCERTAAQLAALTPPGSFVAIRNIKITNCFVRTVSKNVVGALFEIRYGSTNTSESVLNFAAENVEIGNNTLEIWEPTIALRPDWMYSLKWVNGLVAYNNKINLPFKSLGFFDSTFNQANPPSDTTIVPYGNIKINEPYLKYNLGSGQLIDQLQNVNLLADSNVSFVVTNSLGQLQKVNASTSANGTLTNGYLTAEFFGTGYALLTTNRSFAIEMTASGNFYLGKVIAGVKTDQLSTPPINITSTVSEIAIRGETQPTVKYFCKMTLV
jgi:hypothetical protein